MYSASTTVAASLMTWLLESGMLRWAAYLEEHGQRRLMVACIQAV
jgi:hypothetical protein